MAALNIWVVLKKEKIKDFQTALFRVSMLTGWILLLALIIGFMSEPNAEFMLD